MQILGLILVLINVGAIGAPLAAVAVVYQNNLFEIVVPPEAEEIVSDMIESGSELKLPEYESYSYDPASRTASVTFKVTNPLSVDLTVNSIAADVKCSNHNFALGHAALSNPAQLAAEETVTMTVVFAWTQEAEEHFLTGHIGEPNIDISLVNLVFDVSGITVETPEAITLSIPTTL